MKILIVTSSDIYSTYGGGQVYVKNMVDELVRQGIYPVICSPGNINEVGVYYNGCEILHFDPNSSEEEIKLLIDSIDPDLVHAHGFKAQFSKACKALNIPCIITAHHGGILCPAGTLLNQRDEICRIKANPKDCLPCVLKNIRGGLAALPILRLIPLPLRLPLGRIMGRIPFIYYLSPVLLASISIRNKEEDWKSISKDASLLIAPSQAISDSMILNGASAVKIKVIPHGIPLPEAEFSHKNKWINNDEIQTLNFFFVGRICHVKGVHILLAAFDQLGREANLHVVGGAVNKTEVRYMQKLVRKYRHNHRIIWHGKVESHEVSNLICQFDVMIHPAIYMEVFGLNIAEALALGKPVIATRCGGAEMQIKDGVNGWLVEPNNVGAIKDAITNRILHPESVSKLALNCKSNVNSIEDHIHRLTDLYEKIID